MVTTPAPTPTPLRYLPNHHKYINTSTTKTLCDHSHHHHHQQLCGPLFLTSRKYTGPLIQLFGLFGIYHAVKANYTQKYTQLGNYLQFMDTRMHAKCEPIDILLSKESLKFCLVKKKKKRIHSRVQSSHKYQSQS